MIGVTDGARTHDNRNHNPGLYQLSYGHHSCLYRGTNYPAKPRAAPVTQPQRVTQAGLSKTKTGAPDRTRTCNLRLRRPLLYPVELRAPVPLGTRMLGIAPSRRWVILTDRHRQSDSKDPVRVPLIIMYLGLKHRLPPNGHAARPGRSPEVRDIG